VFHVLKLRLTILSIALSVRKNFSGQHSGYAVPNHPNLSRIASPATAIPATAGA
jgi:hypothetical protein